MSKNLYILILVAAWAAYITWEVYVDKWSKAQVGGGAVIRVDLFIFIPILILITVWTVGQIRKKK